MTPPRRVTLYGHWICPYSTRVEFALHQRNIAHDVVDVPPVAVRDPAYVVPREFTEHSPRLEIPMVRVDADYRADSVPILEWLEEAIPQSPLLPRHPEMARVARERMTWIDVHAFRPMIGVYYGTDPTQIAEAAARLADALAQMGTWTSESGWLAGPAPSLAEAVTIPIYVRMEGLRRLGFTPELDADTRSHAERCERLGGWEAVRWSRARTDEFVGRFEAYRRRAVSAR